MRCCCCWSCSSCCCCCSSEERDLEEVDLLSLRVPDFLPNRRILVMSFVSLSEVEVVVVVVTMLCNSGV